MLHCRAQLLPTIALIRATVKSSNRPHQPHKVPHKVRTIALSPLAPEAHKVGGWGISESPPHFVHSVLCAGLGFVHALTFAPATAHCPLPASATTDSLQISPMLVARPPDKAPSQMPAAKSAAEELFQFQLRAHRLTFDRELPFHPQRKWRFDFAHVPARLAVEINGGAYSGGRHHTPAGSEKDWEKLNAAQLLGWKVLQYSPRQIKSGSAILEVLAALKAVAA